ncbi:g1526 [Coccomyxa viridis]|uniref:G1526 protein n=1 Tax=Coccomyxa viridis TaxID=1274662 RepID=A0ABP1FI96_9CHLO
MSNSVQVAGGSWCNLYVCQIHLRVEQACHEGPYLLRNHKHSTRFQLHQGAFDAKPPTNPFGEVHQVAGNTLQLLDS